MRRSLYLAAVEPPGNVAADIARFRRRLFADLGEASARAFPELLPLAFARRLPGASILSRPKLAEPFLARAWAAVEGGFRSRAVLAVEGLAYLGFDGPLAELAALAAGLLPDLGLEAGPGPLATAAGIFLCRPSSASAMEAALRMAPPALAFRDCRLVLYRLELGEDTFAALSWREAAGAGRPGAGRRKAGSAEPGARG